MKTAMNLQRELVQQLESLPEPASTAEMIAMLMHWLEANVHEFGSSAQVYGLGQFINLDVRSFPVEMMNYSPAEEISSFRRVPRSTVDSLAMKVRDALWAAMVWQTSKQCPSCANDYLRALKTSRTERIVLACDFCGWAETLHGERWSGGEALVIMKTEELVAHGLIDRAH
ncbi:hypothetical protein ACMHYB_55630 [Sorangium sp. So ce1128]